METLKNQLKGVKVKIPKRIYYRPHVKQKPRVVIKVTGGAKVARCKVCLARRSRDELLLIEGGGTQGHRPYFICPEHQ